MATMEQPAQTVPPTAPSVVEPPKEETAAPAKETSEVQGSEETVKPPTEKKAVETTPATTTAAAVESSAPEVVPTPAATKEIVILGASYAGLSSAHYFLKHILPTLNTAESTFHVTLVSPSTRFYARPATPRAVASYKLMPVEKVFHDIAAGFANYPAEVFTFVHGTATGLDAASKTVKITEPGGEERIITYSGLIIATGTKTATPLLGLQGDYKDTQSAQTQFQEALKNAKRIFIGGGGPAAVEVAGELAEMMNGKPSLFKKIEKKVEITIITSDSKLLPNIREGIAKDAEAFLRKVGVEVMYNTRVESVTPETAGVTNITEKATLLLANGETMEADLYIPATGVRPNTDFLPKTWLNEKGLVLANDKTLRVDAAGPGVFTVGDVSAVARWGIMDIYSSVPIVMSNLKRDMAALEAAASAEGPDRQWKANLKETQLVTIGSKSGVGAMFGMKLPSFFVSLIKGKDYFTSRAPPIVNGSHWAKESKWDGK